jgi:hypothetical protein
MRSDGSVRRRAAGRLALHLTQQFRILKGAATDVLLKSGAFFGQFPGFVRGCRE